MIYANHAGTSWPKPPEVREAIARALDAAPSASVDLLERSTAEVATALGASGAGRLLFTSGCTSALSVAVGDLPWRAGDVVVTSALEHHALVRPVDALVRHRGVRHEVAPYALGQPIDLDFVEARLREGRVRLIAVTAASNVTGECLPTDALAELAHAHGALLLVDAAQTFGVLPSAPLACGADILTFAGHKGPLGPHGIGGLWASPEVAFETPAAACALDGAPSPASAGFPGYCDVGASNAAGVAGLCAGLAWGGAGRPSSRPSSRPPRRPFPGPGDSLGLARGLRESLRQRPRVRVFGGSQDGALDYTATVSIHLPSLPVSGAEGFFARRGIAVRAGSHCAPMALSAIGAEEGTLRISLGPTNTAEEVGAILEAVDEACEAGA